MFRLFFCAVALALLAGCGAAPAGSAVRASVLDALPATSAPAQPAPTGQPSPTSGSQADAIVIRFERSGGIMGRTTIYSIRADGSVDVAAPLQRDAAQTLPAPSVTAMTDLLTKIATTNITAVSAGDYSPANACCDRYAYSLRLSLDSGDYVYTTVDGAQNQPAPLAEVIDLVQAYIEAVQ